MTVYRWKPGSEWTNGDVQRVGEHLHTLAEQHGERLTPDVVVDAARPDDAPLHPLFEWDDSRAAEAYRCSQARVVMRSIEVVQSEAAPVRMFVAVVEKQSATEAVKSYVPTLKACGDAVLSMQVLDAAMDFMEGFRGRYGHLKELALVADRAQLDIHALMRKREALNQLGPAKRKTKLIAPVVIDVVDIKRGPSQIKVLLDEFDAGYQSKLGAAAPIVAGKDHKLAKQLLERYDIDRLRVWVRRFFVTPDPFIRRSGYTFGVFSSCIGKLIAMDDQRPQLSEKTIRNIQGIYGH